MGIAHIEKVGRAIYRNYSGCVRMLLQGLNPVIFEFSEANWLRTPWGSLETHALKSMTWTDMNHVSFWKGFHLGDGS